MYQGLQKDRLGSVPRRLREDTTILPNPSSSGVKWADTKMMGKTTFYNFLCWRTGRKAEIFWNCRGAAVPGPAQVDTVARGRERLVAATAKAKCPGNVSAWPRVLTRAGSQGLPMPTRAASLMAFQSRKRLEKKLATFATRVEAHALLGIAVCPTPHEPHPLGQ